jgi:peptide/nickel transport system permease protein
MIVALGAQALNVVIKLLLAVPSGYFGGKYDLILQRFIDAWICFPALALYLTVMAVLGPGIWQVIVVLGVNGGISATRVIRSAVIRIKSETYFEAARAIGVPTHRILLRHVLPNVMSLVIISVAAGMGGVISAEASLSFLGLGIPPPYPSWGGMLSGAGRQFMMVAPWMMLWPGIALSLVVFGFNMLADALRDLMDPRLRGGLGRYGGMSQAQLQKLAEKKGASGVQA